MDKKIKVALIGYGFLGKFHAQKVASTGLADLSVIVESDPHRSHDAKILYPQVKIVSNLDDALDFFEAALVVTPTAYHFGIAKKLLELKKHIFCEKPVTSTLSEVEGLIALSEENTTVFHVGHSERHHPLTIPLKLNINSRATGVIQIERVAPFKGRATDTDVVRDVMIHDLDLLNYLGLKNPQIIRTWRHKTISTQIDTFSALIEYKVGPDVFITASRNHVEEKRLWTYSSPHGFMCFDFFKGRFQKTDQDKIEDVQFDKKDHLLEEQINFYRAILGQKSEYCSLRDGAAALEFCEFLLGNY